MIFRATEYILLHKLFLGLENLTTRASGQTNKANILPINPRSKEKKFAFYSSSSLPCILFIPWSVMCSLLGSFTVDNFKPLNLSSEQITNNFSKTVHSKLQCC